MKSTGDEGPVMTEKVMSLEEATAQVKARLLSENYLVIVISDYNKIVLPYKEGIAAMSCFGHAEQLNENYGSATRIEPAERDMVRTFVLSRHEYMKIKIAMLLKVNPNEISDNAIPF